MRGEELLSLVLGAPKSYKTRQQIWHDCIESMEEDDVAMEFGVWNGSSINYMANARPDNEFHGFDSFNGLPKDWIKGRPAGHFKTERSKLRFAPNVIIHDGLFEATIPRWLEANRYLLPRIRLIHIDCDLGSSTNDVLMHLGSVMQRNKCLVLFDEFYNYAGYEKHEFESFRRFSEMDKVKFEVLGRNINHQQALIQVL